MGLGPKVMETDLNAAGEGLVVRAGFLT